VTDLRLQGRLYPDDPGYAAAVAVLVAKAAALGFRVAEPWERASLPPEQLASFSDRQGRLVAPVFVRKEGA
jgi:hypothetical protein